MANIGVLALQGSISEHIKSLSMIEGVNPVEVKTPDQFDNISGLIIPGGESTTIGKLIKEFNLFEPIVKKAEQGMPIWGTCAGLILMSKEIISEDNKYLSILDISVRRNAYGSQLDSFSSKMIIEEISEKPIPVVFIRAPWIESVSSRVKVLAQFDGRIIAVKQENLLATSFHPELTTDLSFHRYFVKLSEDYSKMLNKQRI